MLGAMKGYGMTHSYSSLEPNITGDSPDNSFSTIPYEKGFAFLNYLETLMGKDKF